jgi:hypothetical protein
MRSDKPRIRATTKKPAAKDQESPRK